MKKLILTFSVFTFIACSVLTSCTNSNQKSESAGNNNGDTMNSSRNDSLLYLSDIDTYKKQNSDSIAVNEKMIQRLKTRIENGKAAVKADYTKEISELDKQNAELKMRLDDYKAEGKDKWEVFKTHFNNDMDSLNIEFKRLSAKA